MMLAPEDYQATLELSYELAVTLQAILVDEARQDADRGLDLGPIIDPSLWMTAYERLQCDRDLFAALATAKRACAEVMARRRAIEAESRHHGAAPVAAALDGATGGPE